MLFRSQLVGDALIIFRLEASGHVALVGQEQLTIDLEPVRSQALDTHDKMRSIRVRPELMSDTGLEIEARAAHPADEGLALEDRSAWWWSRACNSAYGSVAD